MAASITPHWRLLICSGSQQSTIKIDSVDLWGILRLITFSAGWRKTPSTSIPLPLQEGRHSLLPLGEGPGMRVVHVATDGIFNI
jgi:hypothetical protein